MSPGRERLGGRSRAQPPAPSRPKRTFPRRASAAALALLLLALLPSPAVPDHDRVPGCLQDLVLSLDASGSVPSQVQDWSWDESEAWLNALSVPDRAAALKFAGDVTGSGPLGEDYPGVVRWIRSKRAADNPDPTRTDILGVLAAANDVFVSGGVRNRRVEVLFTDGGDTTNHTYEEIMAEAYEALALNVTIHVLAWDPWEDLVLIQDIAAVTGGIYREARTQQELADAFDDARDAACEPAVPRIPSAGEIRWLRLTREEGNLTLWWQEVPDAYSYEVYGGPSPRAIDFTTRVALSNWNATSIPVPPADEWYYAVRALREDFVWSFTSPTAAYHARTLPAPAALGLPLEPFEPLGPRSLDAWWMTPQGEWTMADRVLEPGVGLRADGPADLWFEGMPGAHIRWKPGGPELLDASVSAGEILLSWAGGTPPYRVAFSANRTGFWWGTEVRWTGDAAAAALPIEEGYLLVLDAEGRSTYSVGAAFLADEAFSLCSFPGRPLRAWTAGEMLRESGGRGLLTFQGGRWVPHFREMPAGVYDAPLRFPDAFEVDGGRGVWVLFE